MYQMEKIIRKEKYFLNLKNQNLLIYLEPATGFQPIGTSLPIADKTEINNSSPLSNLVLISSKSSGLWLQCKSSRISPASSIKDKKPSSVTSIKVISILLTLGTSMLWVEGDISSYFLPSKMSMPTMLTLA